MSAAVGVEGVRSRAAPRGAWRREMRAALRGRFAPRILRTGEIAALVERTAGSASQRMVVDAVNSLLREGDLLRVQKGLYANALAVPTVSPEEVAQALRPGAVVSLGAVLGDRVSNNPSLVVTAVVPLGSGTPPRVGEVRTGIGVFRFHGIAEEVFAAGAEDDRLDRKHPRFPRATAERAFCDYVYLSQTKWRSLPPPPLDLDLSELRLPVVRRLARAMRIEPALEAWLELKRAFDADENNATQSSPALGF